MARREWMWEAARAEMPTCPDHNWALGVCDSGLEHMVCTYHPCPASYPIPPCPNCGEQLNGGDGFSACYWCGCGPQVHGELEEEMAAWVFYCRAFTGSYEEEQ